MGTITRVFKFDAAHRVMNEKFKCFNLHGHTFRLEVTFSYGFTGSLGYAIDFKEIKRVVGDYIDQVFDHSCLLNPQDRKVIDLCKSEGWKCYIMGMGDDGDINPSAENLAAELFYAIEVIMRGRGVVLESVKLFETENCWVNVTEGPDYLASTEFYDRLESFSKAMGAINYDVRCQ